MNGGMILEFGSRSGSWFALGLFSAMFGALGWGMAREPRVASAIEPKGARVLGLAMFLGPVTMIYVSSLSGFYDAQVDGEMLRLHYFVPGVVREIPLSEVVTARPIPAIRGRQRLEITDRSGRRYESATWYRDSIAKSAARLQQLLPSTSPRRVRHGGILTPTLTWAPIAEFRGAPARSRPRYL